jgi:dolichyl-phosphate-mannose--protein O-mannosyl transferase
MALALTLYLANEKVRSAKPVTWRWPTLSFLIVAAILTAFFYPILTGHSISYEMWNLRMWLPSWV